MGNKNTITLIDSWYAFRKSKYSRYLQFEFTEEIDYEVLKDIVSSPDNILDINLKDKKNRLRSDKSPTVYFNAHTLMPGKPVKCDINVTQEEHSNLRYVIDTGFYNYYEQPKEKLDKYNTFTFTGSCSDFTISTGTDRVVYNQQDMNNDSRINVGIDSSDVKEIIFNGPAEIHIGKIHAPELKTIKFSPCRKITISSYHDYGFNLKNLTELDVSMTEKVELSFLNHHFESLNLKNQLSNYEGNSNYITRNFREFFGKKWNNNCKIILNPQQTLICSDLLPRNRSAQYSDSAWKVSEIFGLSNQTENIEVSVVDLLNKMFKFSRLKLDQELDNSESLIKQLSKQPSAPTNIKEKNI